MSRLFVFTAGKEQARDHLYNSIANPISDGIIDQYLGEAEKDQFKAEDGNFYAWGARPGKRNNKTWDHMQTDDFVLCVYDSIYHYVTKCIKKHHNEELAEAIWGRDDKEGYTWEYMYFLTKPIKTFVPLGNLEQYLNKSYWGFSEIADYRLENISNEYSSVDDFILQEFKPSSSDEVVIKKDSASTNVTQFSHDSLEKELHQELLSLFDRAKEIDYVPTRYLQAVRRKGGLAYAKDKLSSIKGGQTTGLNRALEAGRPDLTLEYTVLQPQFRSLFTDEEIKIAESRLNDFEEAVEIQNEENEDKKQTFNQDDHEKLIELTKEDDLDSTTISKSRKEQPLLRKYLFGKDNFNKCGICSHEYHVDMLVAAHIKKRAECSNAERSDYKNIVMPMCKMGCDDLYEKGYIYIENGKVNKNQDRQHDHTPKISSFIQSFEGRGCPYYNDQTKKYFDWHRSQFVKEIIRFNEGDVIKHNKFGVGKIISTSGDQVQNLSIKFEDQATRTIRSDFANLKLIL